MRLVPPQHIQRVYAAFGADEHEANLDRAI